MKHKRTLALALVLALLLSCTGFTPVRAVSSTQTENTETAQATQDTPADELQAPQFVDSDQFEQNDHVERLYHEERMDTYVYRNSDGTKSVYYMGQNVKYKDKNGNVRDKDTTLVRSDRGYRMRDNDVELHLPDSPADGITLEHQSRRVKLLPQGGRSSANLEDNSIIYPGYFGAETALRYTPLLSGVKEDIILSRYTGENRFSFVLETGGLHLYEKDGQYYLAENENAEAAFYLGQVVVYDAMGRPDEGGMAVETLVPGQKYRLTLSADVNFLTDLETVYPVTIDPTLTVGYTVQGVNAIVDAPIYEGKPNSNYSNYVYDRVGYYNDEYKTARTVMRPDALLSSNEWQSITKFDIVSLKLYIKESSGKSGKQVDVHALTENSTWTESNVTWNNVGAYYPTPYASAILGNDDWAEFDLTSLAVAWKTIIDLQFLQIAQCGFLLKLADESVYRTIYSCEYSTVDYRPYMVFRYHEALTPSKDIWEGYPGTTVALFVSTQLGTRDDATWVSDNEDVASVSQNGVVSLNRAGTATITATCVNNDGEEITARCIVYVKMTDGVYYIKNASSNFCMYASNSLVFTVSENMQGSNINYLLWKVTYKEAGKYHIRPVRDISKALGTDDVGSAVIMQYESGSDDCLWQIQGSEDGYAILQNAQEEKALVPENAAANSSAVTFDVWDQTAPECHWEFEEAEGLFLWNKPTGKLVTTETDVYAEIGAEYSLLQLGIICNDSTELSYIYESSNDAIISVNGIGTPIKAHDFGSAVVTVEKVINDDISYSVSFTVNGILPSQAYILKNKTTKLYLGIEGRTKENGRSVIQDSFDDEDSQRWQFNHIGNSLYTISVFENGVSYFLTVSEDSTAVNQPIVLKTGNIENITDGMKWRIEPTDNDAYKITPLTGNANGCVLATSTSTATEGAPIIQGVYVDNNSYRDEWLIAKSSSILNWHLRETTAQTKVYIQLDEESDKSADWSSIITQAVSIWNNSGIGVTFEYDDSPPDNAIIVTVIVYSANKDNKGPGRMKPTNTNGAFIDSAIIEIFEPKFDEYENKYYARISVVVHEMGHLLGLGDNNFLGAPYQAIMNQNRNREETIIPQPCDMYYYNFVYDHSL